MSETTNTTAEEKTVIDELNPWATLFQPWGSDEDDLIVTLRDGLTDFYFLPDFTLADNDQLVKFVQRVAKAVLPPVETVFRHAWDHGLIERLEGVTVEESWASLSHAEKMALDLWRAMMVAALQTARHHVALQEARAQTAVAMMRKPVPVEDTIFERHGSAFERDPVMVAALEGRIEGNVVLNDGSGHVFGGHADFDPDGRAYDDDHDDHDDEAVPPPSPVSDQDLVAIPPEAVPAVEPDPAPELRRGYDYQGELEAVYEYDARDVARDQTLDAAPLPKGTRRKR